MRIVTNKNPKKIVRFAASVALVPNVIAMIPSIITDSAKDFVAEIKTEKDRRIKEVENAVTYK